MPHTITRIDVTMQATRPVMWPHFAGSTLRGAFGRALRKAACVTGHSQCHGCGFRAQCTYGYIFDPAPANQPLHPSFQDGLPRYVIQPPALGAHQLNAGQQQRFAVLLMPQTQSHQALVMHTLRATVEQELLLSSTFTLLHTQASQVAAAENANRTADVNHRHTPQHPQTTRQTTVTLRWHTPLRLQVQGKPLFKPQQLNAETLVMALLRRNLQWLQMMGHRESEALQATNLNALNAAKACTLNTSNMQWHDIQRHSSTQNTKVPLGGLIGSAQLYGPTQALQELGPLLQLGEQIHIGKETVMGLGRYQLSNIKPA